MPGKVDTELITETFEVPDTTTEVIPPLTTETLDVPETATVVTPLTTNTSDVPEIVIGPVTVIAVPPDIPCTEATLALDVPAVPKLLSNVENVPELVTLPDDRVIVVRLDN